MAPQPTEQPTARELAAVGVLVAVLTAVMLWPLVGGIADHFALNSRDAVFNSWVLAWGADRLAHGLAGFWSPPIYYPYPNVLAYSENLLGITLVVAPVQWLTSNPILTHNIALLMSFVVAGVSAYLLALEITGNRCASLVAALGFAFAPYRWAQLPHLQVLWTAWLPLMLWALHRALRTSKPSHWAMFAAAFLLQVYSNGYSAFQAALAVACVTGAGMMMREVSWPKILRLAGASAVVALLLLPAALVHVRVWSPVDPTPGDLEGYSADLSTYLSVAPGLPDAGWLPGIAQPEGNLFPGIVIGLMALLALLPLGRQRPASRVRWTYVAIGAVAIVLSLGPEPRAWGEPLPLPPIYQWLVSTVPLFDAQRVPARFGVLAVLAFNTLAAVGVARFAGTMQRKAAIGMVAAAGGLIAFEGYGGPVTLVPYTIEQSHAEAAATSWLAAQPSGAMLNLPILTLGETSDMGHQFAVLQHRHPAISGVSRMVTPLVELLSGSGSPLVVPELLPDAVPFLRALGVRYLLLRSAEFYDPSIAGRLAVTLARDPAAHARSRFGEIAAWELDALPDPAAVEPGLTQIRREGFTLTTSDNQDRAALAVDGDPGTRWLAGHHQDGTETFTIAFDRPRSLAQIDFVIHPRSLIHFPRRIEIVAPAHINGAPEIVLFSGSVLPELGRGWKRSPELPTVSITFPPQTATGIIIRQRGQAAQWFWAVDELVLWSRD